MPSLSISNDTGLSVTYQTLPAVGSNVSAASLPVVVASDQTLNTSIFAALKGNTVALTVGATVTSAPVALAAQALGTVTCYRVRNASASASPVAWRLSVANTDFATVATAYSAAGTGGAIGDTMIDAGGVEIHGLSAAQQTALAAGTLYLTAVCPTGGSAVLYVSPGTGA